MSILFFTIFHTSILDMMTYIITFHMFTLNFNIIYNKPIDYKIQDARHIYTVTIRDKHSFYPCKKHRLETILCGTSISV